VKPKKANSSKEEDAKLTGLRFIGKYGKIEKKE